MSNITLTVIVLFVLFWLSCLLSALLNKFKNKKVKVFWVIGLIFVPFLSFFYIFLKKDLLQK